MVSPRYCLNCTYHNRDAGFCNLHRRSAHYKESCANYELAHDSSNPNNKIVPWTLEEYERIISLPTDHQVQGIWTCQPGKPITISRDGAAQYILSRKQFITTGDKVFSMLYYENGYYKQGGEKEIQRTLQELTKGKLLTIQTVREITGQIQRQTFRARAELENIPLNLICLQNGILDLQTMQLQPHDPGIPFCHQIPIRYNPEAKCPKILKFLSEVLEPEAIPVFQETTGFMLLRNYAYKKAFIFVGEKDTGKTTLIKLLVIFIGKENTSSESLHKIIKDKFSAINLKDKLLNFYDDLSSDDINETGGFKIATGNGYLSGEHKFGERFQFQNYAKLLFACNKIFGLKDRDADDDAYYDRWIIFFFNNVFEPGKAKLNLLEELTSPEELSGFLNWALEGLERLKTNGKFSYNKTAEENKILMQRGSNNLAGFAQDCLEQKQGDWISKEDMFQAYSAYVAKNGGVRQTKEKFGRDLPKFAPYIFDSKQDKTTGWRNVRFNQTFQTNFLLILDNELNSKYEYKKSMNSMFDDLLKDTDYLVEDLIKVGYTKDQLDVWKAEGLIYEPISGVVRIV